VRAPILRARVADRPTRRSTLSGQPEGRRPNPFLQSRRTPMRRMFPRSSRIASRSFGTSSPRRMRHRAFRPTLELMEGRALLSTFVVNTGSALDRAGSLPVGQESLRQAIEDANADTTPDVIDFNIGGGGHQVINLTSGLPVLGNAITIDGTTQPG